MQVICTSGAWWRGSVLPRGECWRGMVSWLTWQCCRSIPPGTARLIKKYVREQEFHNNAERERLRQWSARFQAFPPCHIIDDHDWNEMDDQLRGFAGELRCVLGPEYRVAG